jgi:hypothetical protein
MNRGEATCLETVLDGLRRAHEQHEQQGTLLLGGLVCTSQVAEHLDVSEGAARERLHELTEHGHAERALTLTCVGGAEVLGFAPADG